MSFAAQILAAGRVAPMERDPFVVAVGEGTPYFAIGYESNIPPTYRALTTPLVERYGIPAGELVFGRRAVEGAGRGAGRRRGLVALPSRTGLHPLEWTVRDRARRA